VHQGSWLSLTSVKKRRASRHILSIKIRREKDKLPAGQARDAPSKRAPYRTTQNRGGLGQKKRSFEGTAVPKAAEPCCHLSDFSIRGASAARLTCRPETKKLP